MARLISIASGNNSAASTWGLVEPNSYAESEGTSITVPTTYATTYNTFIPAANTSVDGVAIRIHNRLGTTGTLKVELYNITDSASVAGTEVTVNCSDVVPATTTELNGGWMFFKFASSVNILSTKSYIVRFKTSSSNIITVSGSGSTSPSRMVRTTTTQAPVAGDDRFVMGEWTAAGSMTSFTITMDDTANTDYGSGATSTATPALSISNGGVMNSGTSASTTYTHKLSGNLIIYYNGEFNVASSGSRMPTTSSFTLTFDCVTNVDFGMYLKSGGKCSFYGASKTRWTLLTADAAVAATTLTVADTTGWVGSDSLTISSTSNTLNQYEIRNTTTIDSSTQVTISAGLTNAHTGSGDLQATVVNLNSNVMVRGTSGSVATYIHMRSGAICTFDQVDFRYIGSSTTLKRGFDVLHVFGSGGSVTVTDCVFREPSANGSNFFGCSQANGAYFYFTRTAFLSNSSNAIAAHFTGGGGTSTPDYSVVDCVVIGNGANTGATIAGRTNGTATISGIRVSGYSTGFSLSANTAATNDILEISDSVTHSNTVGIALLASGIKRNFTNVSVISNTSGASGLSGINYFNSCNFYGNSSAGVVNTLTSSVIYSEFNSCNFRGRTGFAQPAGLLLSLVYGQAEIVCNSCNFGSTTAHTTADISLSNYFAGKLTLNNTTMASTVDITSNAYNYINTPGYISIQRLDGVAGDHKVIIEQGVVTRDTTIYRSASPSVRITPQSASIDASTIQFPFLVPVNNGQTVTPTIYVRESVIGDGTDYTGARVKLYVKKNVNLGITSDTLLDTATVSSEGAWENLTGTTAAATDDGVMEFYLTCNGSSGWINYDDFTATVA